MDDWDESLLHSELPSFVLSTDLTSLGYILALGSGIARDYHRVASSSLTADAASFLSFDPLNELNAVP